MASQSGSDCSLAKKPSSQKTSAKGRAARDAAIAKSPAFVKAARAYQQGKYKEAITLLENLDAHGGCCQWTHYYLGLCYQGLNQLGLSYRHYEWVLSFGKDPNLRRYSQFAQETLTYYAANRTYAGQSGIMGAVAESRGGGGGGGGGGGFG